MRPLRGIAFLSRGEENRASEISISSAVTRFMKQIYIPKESAQNAVRSMLLADRVLRAVKLISLECNMDAEAAHICRAALTEDA
jgi:hypothetical protein